MEYNKNNHNTSKQLTIAGYLTFLAFLIITFVLMAGRNLSVLPLLPILMWGIPFVFIFVSIILSIDILMYKDEKKLIPKVIITLDICFFVFLIIWFVIASKFHLYYKR